MDEFDERTESFTKEAELSLKSLQLNGNTHGTYSTTVFLLDTSDSMSGEGLEQMKTVFKDIINEFSTHPSISENVMVATFGRRVKIIQNFSTDYSTVSKCVDCIECGGSSPLEEGIRMCAPCFQQVPSSLIGSFHVRTKIVIITDGKPTEPGVDEEVYECSGLNDAGKSIIAIVNTIGKYHPIFCIPVGQDPDICFLGTMVIGSEGGRLVSYQEARQLGRHSINIDLASKVLPLLPSKDKNSREDIRREVSRIRRIPENDLDDVCEIIDKKAIFRSLSNIIEEENEKGFQERDPKMPHVGTRVRRGPDWQWKNQDGRGTGTVVGHSERVGWIKVEWDTGLLMPYRYGTEGLITAYDIEPSDEPRILTNESIAVGCLVRRGLDWKWGDQDGGEGKIGTVYRLKTPTEIYVRWPNGNKSNYRYGYKSCYDVEICDPFDQHVQKALEAEKAETKHRHELILGKAKNSKPQWAVSRESMSKDVNAYKRKRASKETLLGHANGKTFFKNSSDKISANRVWQWQTLDNVWKTFPKDALDAIDNCLKGKMETATVILNGQICKIDLHKRRMVNTVTSEQSDIRIYDFS